MKVVQNGAIMGLLGCRASGPYWGTAGLIGSTLDSQTLQAGLVRIRRCPVSPPLGQAKSCRIGTKTPHRKPDEKHQCCLGVNPTGSTLLLYMQNVHTNIYIYIYTYVYTYTYRETVYAYTVNVYTSLHICIYICIQAISICIYVYIYTYTHAFIQGSGLLRMIGSRLSLEHPRGPLQKPNPPCIP